MNNTMDFEINQYVDDSISENLFQEDILDKYTTKKKNNEKLLNYIVKYVSDAGLSRIEDCSGFLQFVGNKEMDKKKLVRAKSCKYRYCPVCAWRASRKEAIKLDVCMKYIGKEHNKRFIFLTLTAPNVTGDLLSDEITKYNDAFKKLLKRKEVLRINKGCVRKLEITYNKEPKITKDMWNGNKDKHIYSQKRYFSALGLKIGDDNPNYDTYHVHFHIIMAVNKSYFSDNKVYITHADWLDLWRSTMNDANITIVHVTAVKEHNEMSLDDDNAISDESVKSKSLRNDNLPYEIAKYTAKDGDYLYSNEVFDVFYKALHRRQNITYNGLFKDAVKMYKDGELDKYKDSDDTEYVYMLLYQWGFGEYVQAEKRELNVDERIKFNHQMLSDKPCIEQEVKRPLSKRKECETYEQQSF